MGQSLKRNELRALAESKIDDARLLLCNRRWGNAYYLAGYAVELGLKACIAKQIVAQAIPDKKLIEAAYTHKLASLVGVAGLTRELRDEQRDNPEFATYWGIAGEWSEAARYESTEAYSAQLMVQAVDHPDAGIMRWIRQHW